MNVNAGFVTLMQSFYYHDCLVESFAMPKLVDHQCNLLLLTKPI
jgi:hypothetical protein